MKARFPLLSVAAACVAVLAVMLAMPMAASAQEPEQQQRQLEDWEREELRTLVEVVSAALQGQLQPTDRPFELNADFLKGTEGKTYVPFTVTIDPDKVGESTVALYLYITAPQAASSAAADTDTADTDTETPQVPPAIFEDAHFVDVSAQRASGEPIRISRAFAAAGGDYDLYLAIRDSKGPEADEDDQPVPMMLRERLTVPDLWTDDLSTSSVIVAAEIEPLTQPLTPEQQIENPYTLGTTRIVPKHARTFGKEDELSLIMLVYNPQLTGDQKPDLTIEYTFHQQTDGGGEEYFNKTNPQQFNAQTLPAGFDVALGHQIVAGQSVPLSLFPAGSYRLEIIVTDNAAGTSLSHDVNFTVEET